MNQQQDSQASSSQFEDEQEQATLASPWLIQDKGRRYEGPKSEHPSTYDESIPPLSYRAQDQRQASSSSSPKAGASPEAAHKTSPQPDTPKMAHRPYSQYTGSWQVPSWARPPGKDFGTIWLYVLAAILALPVLWFIITVVLPVVVVIFLVIMGILLLAFVIIAAVWFIGRIDSKKPPFWW